MKKSMTTCLFILCLLPYSINAQILSQNLDKYMSPLVNASDFYGTVLFAKNGEIELVKSYGYADLEHQVKNTSKSVYHMGSVNKPITAVAVMLLHQQKKLNINDFLDKYIPKYPGGKEISIKHLLSQTAGIPSYNEFSDYSTYSNQDNTLSELVDWIKQKDLLFKPGTQFEYSNSNYVILAYLIEIVSGENYSDFMQTNIFQPLGMEHTGMFKYDEIVPNRAIGYDPANNQYNLKPIGFYNNSNKVGSGAIHSTVLDMLKFSEVLYTDKILTPQIRNLMLTEVDENDYGLGWGIWPRFDKKKYDHDGSSPGSVAYFSYYPDDKVTIIFLGNVNSGVFHSMKYQLAAIYFNKEFKIPAEKKYVSVDAEQLKKFEGRYEFESGNFFDLKVVNEDLRFLWRGRGELGYLLSPLSDTQFYMRARGDQINFKIDETGNLSASYVERSGVSQLKIVDNSK